MPAPRPLYGLPAILESSKPLLGHPRQFTSYNGTGSSNPPSERVPSSNKAKRRTNVPTFCEAAERVFEANRPRWRNVKHTVTWLQSLERHAYPVLGNMPVDTINQEDVLRVLMPIWGTTPETARRVRQRIRTILKWAQAHRFVEHNAAGEVIDGALPAMPKVKNHLRALPYQEVGGSVEAVRQSQASLAVKWCLEFLILTAVRSGEARGAAWSEIDMDAATWTVPAARMKANAEHRVPLCGRALEILEEARAIDDGSGLVFPSPSLPGRPLSDMILTALLRRIGVADRVEEKLAITVSVGLSYNKFLAKIASDLDKPRGFALIGRVEAESFLSDKPVGLL